MDSETKSVEIHAWLLAIDMLLVLGGAGVLARFAYTRLPGGAVGRNEIGVIFTFVCVSALLLVPALMGLLYVFKRRSLGAAGAASVACVAFAGGSALVASNYDALAHELRCRGVETPDPESLRAAIGSGPDDVSAQDFRARVELGPLDQAFVESLWGPTRANPSSSSYEPEWASNTRVGRLIYDRGECGDAFSLEVYPRRSIEEMLGSVEAPLSQVKGPIVGKTPYELGASGTAELLIAGPDGYLQMRLRQRRDDPRVESWSLVIPCAKTCDAMFETVSNRFGPSHVRPSKTGRRGAERHFNPSRPELSWARVRASDGPASDAVVVGVEALDD